MPQTIYDLLTGVKIDDATITQLDSATGRTFVDTDTREFWQGILTLSHVIRAARTYPLGGPIPEASAIAVQVCPLNESITFQPPGTEVWAIQGIQITAAGGTPACTISLFDGSEAVAMHAGTSSTTAGSFFPFEAPFYITNSVYLAVTNADGSNAVNVSIAYNKVSL